MQEVKIDQVVKAYGRQLALKQVSFTAKAGEVVAICGENGAGKSTLIGILAGARQPTEGRVLIDGQPITIQNPSHAFALGIRTVYQELSLLQPLSVAENLQLGALPMKYGTVNWRAAYAEAERQLAQIGMHEIDVSRPVSDYSVAIQQMLEIAKALVHRPELLILDEPTGVLTARESRLLFERIRALKAGGTIVLYISHRLDEVFEIADRVVVLKDGSTVDIMERAEATHERLVKSMVGRPLGAIYPECAEPKDNVVFRAAGLTGVRGFSGVDFDIRAGEIVGFFGLIGSGRTEVARTVFGADPLVSGEMVLDGAAFRPRSPRDAIRSGLAFVTEERKRDGLLLEANVLDNGGLASMRQVSVGPFLNRRRERDAVGKKARELDVRPGNLDQLLRNMSGGNQQKVILAKWLLVDHLRLLILDEPTRGVDIATKVEIYKLIAELAAKGVAILTISSEIPELLGLSHRINVMRTGRIVARFDRSVATEERLFAAAANVRLEAA
jgi:ABC-type sugar transport system ATPase subunit